MSASHARAWVMQDPQPLGHSRTFPFHSISGPGKLGQPLSWWQLVLLSPPQHLSPQQEMTSAK